jgi:type II secretory ATPase GspE/PulE/Tfp pilus assembly ATPase PilB-like protein
MTGGLSAKRAPEREFVEPAGMEPPLELLRAATSEGMRRFRFLPIREEGGRLVVASPDWQDPLHRDEIEQHLNRPVKVVACSREAFDAVIGRWADSARALRPSGAALAGPGPAARDGEGEARAREALEESSPVVRMLNGLLIEAVRKGASDIHFEAEDGRSFVRFRLDGVLVPASEPIDELFHPRLVSRIKVVSDLDISETRRSQDGRFRFTVLGRPVDFRVSVIPASHGEDVVIRILDKEHLKSEFAKLSLGLLGFDEATASAIRRLTQRPHGMFLVAGPTGSGKTTSLYAALQEMDHAGRKVVTIEDPVEYDLPGIVQIPVNEAKGVGFASGLRAVLRHDPDVVMVGEIRDRETAEVAVQAALTGHLVFSTVHANSGTDVILRFLHMGIEPHNFVSAVNGVLSQRLLRGLCRACRRPAPARTGATFDAGGCPACNGTGYRGRKAVGELVPFTDEIREWLVARRPSREIRAGLARIGVASMRENALRLAADGTTTIAEVDRVVPPNEGS